MSTLEDQKTRVCKNFGEAALSGVDLKPKDFFADEEILKHVRENIPKETLFSDEEISEVVKTNPDRFPEICGKLSDNKPREIIVECNADNIQSVLDNVSRMTGGVRIVIVDAKPE